MTARTFTFTVTAPSGLPTWRQAMSAGQFVKLTPTNTFHSQKPSPDPDAAQDGFAFGAITDAYSGGVLAPDLGSYGSLILHGGGHGDSLNNCTVKFDLSTLTFTRLDTPTPTGSMTPTDLALALYADGQPQSCHSYDNLVVVPPALGGAAAGTLLRVIGQACGRQAVNVTQDTTQTGWTYGFSLSNPTARWSQYSVNAGTTTSGGGTSVLDEATGRVIYHQNPSNGINALNVLTLSTATHSAVTLTSNAGHVFSQDTQRMFAVSSRRIACITGYNNGSTANQLGWFDLDNLATGVRLVAFSGTALPSASYGFTADLCTENGKIYGIFRSDLTGVYEITIPATLTDPWPVTRLALSPNPIDLWTLGSPRKRWSWSQKCRAFIFMTQAKQSGLAWPSQTPVYAYVPLGVT